MKKQTVEGVTSWTLSAWWDKTIYVLGWFFSALFVLGFLKGFFSA